MTSAEYIRALRTASNLISHSITSQSGQHQLHHTWAFWYTHRAPNVKAGPTNYEEQMKLVSSVSSIEEFWSVYQHFKRPTDLPVVSDYMMFKAGIKPVWEDEQNCNGGKWIVRIKKGLADRFWDSLVLATIADQLDFGDDICGLVLSIRSSEDVISVWNRSSQPQHFQKIRDALKKILSLPAETVLEYKPHKDAMRQLTFHGNKTHQQNSQQQQGAVPIEHSETVK